MQTSKKKSMIALDQNSELASGTKIPCGWAK